MIYYTLVTGGLGYIGSHVSLNLINYYNEEVNNDKNQNKITKSKEFTDSHKILILDNLSSSDYNTFETIKILSTNNVYSHFNLEHTEVIFIKGDIRDKLFLRNLFETYKIKNIIHLAGLKSVEDSNKQKDLYYDVNVNGSKHLIDLSIEYHIDRFIYSSSATVYGCGLPADLKSFSENDKSGENLTSEYARNKYEVEEYIKNKYDHKVLFFILRYFNPINSLPFLEENPASKNIYPRILKCIKNNEEFKIFGNDYETRDGTCERDYIHVNDLAMAHLLCLKENPHSQTNNENPKIYNVGTGKSTTVLELVKTFGDKLKYTFSERRKEDSTCIISNPEKIMKELNFSCKFFQ